jgi:adenylate cyclase
MATEIEHKFLVANDDWRALVSHSADFKQGYLNSDATSSVRVRIAGQQAWLNIKSATIGTHRMEFEYEIPVVDADEIIAALCHKPLIEKTRYFVNDGQHVWEIDVFAGENQGLIVAEIELSEIGEAFNKPSWLGEEVTQDVRYYNNNLSRQPFSSWSETSAT